MQYREIIALCSQIHIKHMNTPCGHGVEFVNAKLVVHIVTTGL
jgi:predicted nuclease with TOPRIM domain